MGDVEIYTMTMARVYEGQGYLGKAADIYRHLMEQNPQDSRPAEALARVEGLLQTAGRQGRPAPELLREWLQLLFRYRNLRKLKEI
jgi:hypothetical protein